MTEESQEEITLLLSEIAAGSEAAKEQLIVLVYSKLHKMAGGLMVRERTKAR